MTDFIRFFIPFYFIFFFGVSFLGISILVARRIGKNPDVLPKDDSAYGLIGLYFKITIFSLFIYALFILIFPDAVFSIFQIRFLNIALLKYLGISLMVIAFIWVFIAQIQMKNSWRIGIDNELKTPLITHGLFRFSRNPVFLGMTMSLTGFFFTFPTMIAFLFLITGSILMQIQIRLEEAYLLVQHGSAYSVYKKSVGRMLGFIKT